MSAGGGVGHGLAVNRDLGSLAPGMRQAVAEAVAASVLHGYDAWVWEARRSPELQAIYYARGRPPTAEYPAPVTYAPDVWSSWHAYGLAVDVVSRSRLWFAPRPILSTDPVALAAERARSRAEAAAFYAGLVPIFEAHGLAWGGHWAEPHTDQPHFQWARLKPSPSARARALYAAGGLPAVWAAVGALEAEPTPPTAASLVAVASDG